MQTYIRLSDDRLLPAVLFCVCLLALVLMLTVRITKPEVPQHYYSKDFDRGSFQDLGIIGLILLPFIIIYVLRNWV